MTTQLFIAAVVSIGSLSAQIFDSKSNGSDGDLILTTPGTIVFDPKSFTPVLNPAGDGVYQFKSITIGAGVTVKLLGSVLKGPVYWLALGPVQIDGTIDLSGGPGHSSTVAESGRVPSVPGAGGFSGGIGSAAISGASYYLGSGPGGGTQNMGGKFVGSNQFLIPLIGGSGGGGYAAGGGAGGGALLIASSSSITLTGTITANGGDSGAGDPCYHGGSGGAIRLAAQTIAGAAGTLTALGGCSGGPGVVRVEAVNNTLAATIKGTSYSAIPYGVFAPVGSSQASALTVVTVNGSSVVTNPTGSFTVPDVTLTATTPVPVVIQATGIPAGTTVTLLILSDNGGDRTYTGQLTGPTASSSTTISATFAPAYSLAVVSASFTTTPAAPITKPKSVPAKKR